MTLGLIWAEARGAIGRDGDMPWHLPEDLAHFKAVTMGAPVIMGRRTWGSLPERFRPLPGRDNIVVTRNPGFEAPGATVASSLEAAVSLAGQDPARDKAWVIGGGQIYREALPLASELVITRIDLNVPDADTFAPVSRADLDADWILKDPGVRRIAANGLAYRFERWIRDKQ